MNWCAGVPVPDCLNGGVHTGTRCSHSARIHSIGVTGTEDLRCACNALVKPQAAGRILPIETLSWTLEPFENSMHGQEPLLNPGAHRETARTSFFQGGWVVARASSGLVLFLFVAAPAPTQTFRGGINGIVTDQSGAVVLGAEIRATNEATSLSYVTASSNAGEFSFQDLPLGNYTIVVSSTGFQTVRIDTVRVSAGAIYTLPVKLSVAQASSTVEVSAAALALDTTATTLTTVVSSATVENRPLNGRDFVQMIAVSPGFSGYAAGATGSVNGARANQVNWQIDGTDNNDQWWNIMAVNQGGIQSIPGVLMPLDSVEEFSLQTQAGPETGRNPGGTINLVIKSGTNKLHGSAYYYNRNEFFTAQSPFAPAGSPKNKLRNEHYGFAAGFPVIKDRTFLFLSFEEQKFLIGNQSLSTEPSLNYQAAARSLLNKYS